VSTLQTAGERAGADLPPGAARPTPAAARPASAPGAAEAIAAGAAGIPVVASAPGKLILAGEHAVVYGRPALVAAVDLRLAARFSAPAESPGSGSRSAEVHLDLPWLGPPQRVAWAEIATYARLARQRWERFAAAPGPESFRALRGDDPLHLVKVALGEAAASLGEAAAGLGEDGEAHEAGRPLSPPLAVRLDSDLPAGSGMGSSAAAAAALVAGYLAWRGAPGGPAGDPANGDWTPGPSAGTFPQGGLSANIFAQGGLSAAWLACIERLALEVERRQHGSPSGVDVAAVLRGGLLWVERLPDGALATAPAAAQPALLTRLAVYQTGEPPEPTGEVVAAVAARRAARPAAIEAAFDRITAGTRALAAALASPAADPLGPIGPLRAVEAALEELGVVPAPVREAVRQVEQAGGAAKVSGAGSLAGPAAGMLLVYHPDAERAAAWPFPARFARCPIHLGAPGLRLEPRQPEGARPDAPGDPRTTTTP
jgi:mevalonate kinase